MARRFGKGKSGGRRSKGKSSIKSPVRGFGSKRGK